jgi:chemotaxis protein CheZ
VQRKTFRIEHLMARPRGPMSGSAGGAHETSRRANGADPSSLERELALTYEAIEKIQKELTAMSGSGCEAAQLSRAGSELGAAIDGMEKATHRILKVAEGIDEGVRALRAAMKDDYQRGVAHDILDQVAHIFEACNFQDISGQRINKAMATLKSIEDRIERMQGILSGVELSRHAAKTGPMAHLLNGPKLEADRGHATQADVDRMFTTKRA